MAGGSQRCSPWRHSTQPAAPRGYKTHRGHWPRRPYVLPQWCPYDWLSTSMCVTGIWTRKDEAEVSGFCSCIFILQSLMGLIHFPDYQHWKIYIFFFVFFLVLPSCYMKIPLQTYLWDSWSCREHFMTPPNCSGALSALWRGSPCPCWGWLCPGTSTPLGGDHSSHHSSWGRVPVTWADLTGSSGSRSVSRTWGQHLFLYFGGQGDAKFIPGSAWYIIYPRMDTGH